MLLGVDVEVDVAKQTRLPDQRAVGLGALATRWSLVLRWGLRGSPITSITSTTSNLISTAIALESFPISQEQDLAHHGNLCILLLHRVFYSI